jgi:hypothetical protein
MLRLNQHEKPRVAIRRASHGTRAAGGVGGRGSRSAVLISKARIGSAPLVRQLHLSLCGRSESARAAAFTSQIEKRPRPRPSREFARLRRSGVYSGVHTRVGRPITPHAATGSAVYNVFEANVTDEAAGGSSWALYPKKCSAAGPSRRKVLGISVVPNLLT